MLPSIFPLPRLLSCWERIWILRVHGRSTPTLVPASSRKARTLRAFHGGDLSSRSTLLHLSSRPKAPVSSLPPHGRRLPPAAQ